MGTDTGHREADLAMSLLKTDLMLQENVFYLEDGLPTKEHADPWGKVQVFHKQSGWQTFPPKTRIWMANLPSKNKQSTSAEGPRQ